jgi:hypothetical protein
MSSQPDPPDIQVTLINNVISTNPNRFVSKAEAGQPVTVEWRATIPFTEFPDPARGHIYFAWEEPEGKPEVRRIDSRTLRTTYPSPEVTGAWKYTIWCQPINGTPIGQDPEIDNQRPPFYVDEESRK